MPCIHQAASAHSSAVAPTNQLTTGEVIALNHRPIGTLIGPRLNVPSAAAIARIR